MASSAVVPPAPPALSPKSGVAETPPGEERDENLAQTHIETALVEVFSELADLFGNPRSHGQIYGLLFSSPEPMRMEDIARRLGISIGSASQGLRVLEEIGAVERDTSGRYATFTARAELKTLIAGFVQRRLVPRIEANLARLDGVRPDLSDLGAGLAREYRWRLERVTKWHRRALDFLPLARKLLDGV